MTPPLETEAKPEKVAPKQPPEELEDALQTEASSELEKPKAAVENPNLVVRSRSGEVVLAGLEIGDQTPATPATTESIKRANGDQIIVDKDSKGAVTRIAETDGSEWRRSEDGKFFVLNTSKERIPTKAVKVESDGSYSFTMPDGKTIKRNSDRSVSTLDAQGNETRRTNNDGTEILFNKNKQVIATRDANGLERGYGYDSKNQLTSIVEPDGSTWKSTDGKNWQNPTTRQTRSGEITIASDGAQTVKNARGDTTTFKVDGSQVSRNSDGQVTAVKNADGVQHRFEYKDGKVVSMTSDGKAPLTTSDGKTWTQQGEKPAQMQLSVDSDGTIRQKTNKVETALRTDGWVETKEGNQTLLQKANKDGSITSKNALEQITEIKSANGKSRQFEYSPEGKMVKMTDSTGTWTSADGSHWKNEKTHSIWAGRREAAQDGLYREVSESGDKKIYKPDGSVISADPTGKISRVTDATGQSRSFEYGPEGQIKKITESTGASWSTTDGTTWRKNSGNEVREMKVSVRTDGTYEEKDLKTGNRTVGLTDGRSLTFDKESRIQNVVDETGAHTKYSYDKTGKVESFEVSNKDGSQITYDANGRVSKTKSVDNQVREFKHDDKGKLIEVKEANKVWTSKDGENWTSDKGEKHPGKSWVTPDGKYHYVENNAVVTKQLDGNTSIKDMSGASRLLNKDNKIIETTDTKGVKRTYGWTGDKVTSLTDGGETWTSTDGHNWKNNKDNQPWKGTVEVKPDGTYYQEDSAGNRQWKKPDGSLQNVNYNAMEKAADVIEYAMNGGTGIGTDKDDIYAALEGKSLAERQMITEIWNKKYKAANGGRNLEAEFADEMGGSDLDKALALLKKPDGADNAGTIRVALTERGEWSGRSAGELEKVIRNTLETMSAADIAKTDAEYQSRYGMSLKDAIRQNRDLSADTKAAADIYLKGFDHRTVEDTSALAKRAVNSGDVQMFQEAMRRAPDQVREYYASPQGQNELKNKFEDGWYNVFGSNTDLRHVQDYAEHGKLSVTTQVKDNTSRLGDNEEAIEHSLSEMTASERQSYVTGKRIANNEALEKPLTEAEKQKALDYYTKTHAALEYAAGAWYSGDSKINELAKWEDMITQKGGSLVSKLANHRGSIYDSSMHEVIGTIENMPKEDWDKLKTDPKQRDRIQDVLKTYLSDDELSRAMTIVDGKKAQSSFEASQQQRRSVLDTIEDNRAWYNNDESQMYKAVENMTDRERELYRKGSDPNNTDAEAKAFATALDQKLTGNLDESEQKVAFGLLDQVRRGEKPAMSIIDKMNLQASYFDADEAQVIRDIQEAFDKDKTLRERIANPKTDADKAYAAQFKAAAESAMGSSDYAKYAKPLIETGKLSAALQLDLSRGYFDDDEQGAYKDIQRASDTDKQRILTDKAFQDRVFGFLSADERKVALASMQQGEMRPEDKLRSYQVGMGTSEEEIKQTFAQLQDRTALKAEGKSEEEIDRIVQERIQNVRNEYARKYGADLSADLVSELGGKDKRQVMRIASANDARGEFLSALNEAATTRSGFGSGFVDRAWDGTGYQLDNEINQLSKIAVEDPAKMRDYVSNVRKMVDLHADSKEALADAVVDTTIATVAVAGAFVTGGVSLSLLAYTGAAGAVFKVGTKAAIMGGDYDLASRGLLDAGTGFADGFTTFLGAGAAKSAAQKVLTSGGKTLLREGAETSLKEGTEQLVKQGLKEGGKISDEAISALAKQISKDGQEKAVQELLKKSLAESIEQESRSMLKQLIMSTPDNALAGLAGSGASGTIRAGYDAKDFKQFLEMAGTSAAFGTFGGGAGAFVLAPGLLAAGKSWSAVRSRLSSEVSTLEQVAARAGDNVHIDGRVPDVEGVSVKTPADVDVTNTTTTRVEGEQPVVKPVVEQPKIEGDKPVVKPDQETPEIKDGPDKSKVDDLAREVAETTPKAKDRVVSLERIQELSKEIAEMQNRPAIGREQFAEILNKIPASDKEGRLLAQELLEQSVPNMHRKALDNQLEAISKKIQELHEGGAKKITVVATDEDSSGKALAYLLRTNSGIEVDIKVLDPRVMAEGISPSNPVLILDDLAKLNPEQAAFLNKVPKVYASDVSGFDTGINAWDLGIAKMTGNTETMQARVAELVAQAQALKAADPSLSNQDAIRRIMTGKLDDNAAKFPNMQIVRAEELPRTNKTGQRSPEAIWDASVSRPIFNPKDKLFFNVQQKDVETFLNKQRMPSTEKGAPGIEFTAAEKEAAAIMLRDSLRINSYDNMLSDMHRLHEKLISSLPPGKTIDDVVILTRLEENGSANLMHHLYSKTENLKSSNFVSAADFQANPAKFKDKVIVYMDDYSFTGRQPEKLLTKPLEEGVGATTRPLSEAIKESGAPVIIAHLGGYLPEGQLQNVFEFKPTVIYSHEGVLPQIYDTPELNKLGFTTEELQAISGKPGYVTKDATRNSDVAQLNPHRSHPTNNRSLISTFVNQVLKENGIPGPKMSRRPRPVTKVDDNLFRGGEIASEADLKQLVSSENIGVIVDLRGGPGTKIELDKVADEITWAANLGDKAPTVRNVGIPHEWPMRGSPNYNKMMDDLQEFERILKQAKEDGKNVYVHCYHGEDRTGLVNAFHDVISNGKTVEQAMETWKAAGTSNNIGFNQLFRKEQFEQLVADYRARLAASSAR